MKLPGSPRLWILAARSAVALAIVAVSLYALAGIPSVFFLHAGRPLAPRTRISETDNLPTPPELVACLLGEGYWAFPGHYWSFGQTEVKPSDIGAFWQALTEQAASVDTFDPDKSFDDLLPAFREMAESTQPRAGVILYRVTYGDNVLGCATRMVKGTERVVGGALLALSESGNVGALQLKANSLYSSNTAPPRSTLSDVPGSRLIAARYSLAGVAIAELVEIPRIAAYQNSVEDEIRSEQSLDSVVVRVTSRSRDYFEWTTLRRDSQLKVIVAADGLQRMSKDASSAAIHLENP